MNTKRMLVPIAVAVVALAALGTIGWAATRDQDSWGMMHGGSGMMGYASTGSGEPVRDPAGARRQAQRFADRLGLRVGEVMQFDNQFYAELKDRSGRPATEVLVDRRSGSVWLEYGPAMMWNTRYGMMGANGMMDGSGAANMMGSGWRGAGPPDATWPSQATGRTVDAAGARTTANVWLKRNLPGTTAGEPEAFPGYFTLHVERGGKIEGMLSVNASTGAVWYHWWHGKFVAMAD